MKNSNRQASDSSGRREFIKKSGIVLAGSSLINPATAFASSGHYQDSKLKVGLIGCGGRGTGAAAQALQAGDDVILTAMGDVFEDRLEGSLSELVKIGGERVKVDSATKFIGFDAYEKVIATGVDVVILTTPPAFRPAHLEAAVEADKHIFCEKPMAVDAPGVRKIIAAAKKAKEKNLSVVAGFTYRFGLGNRATFERINNGAIGKIKSVSTFRYGGELWYKERQPDWTDMTYQLRNWYYYNWLSGDFIVEQAVHSLDLMSWAMNDVMPTTAMGSGGRQVRTEEKYGNIYDHFSIEFSYPDGAKGYHFTRQQADTDTRNSVDIFGEKGSAEIHPGRKYEIVGAEKWQYEGEENNMYQTQHDELFASIRNGNPINDGEQMANSTFLAIWARMAGYSGKKITWDEAYNSNHSLGPQIDQYDWSLNWPMPPIAIPGKTEVI
ncbi:MAG: Gfo/Idh/MocA family oxidoreductase [Pricia sp.]|nr:Gfo/Idh/MocA family oxidoreductase [Pricia sp.]